MKNYLTHLCLVLFLHTGAQTASYENNNNGIGGTFNSGFGYNCLSGVNNGDYNSAMGFEALRFINDGSFNTGCGKQALYFNEDADFNTAIGYRTLYNNNNSSSTTGSSNTAVGAFALRDNDGGEQNTAFGTEALYSNTTGDNNTAAGYGALFNNSNASSDAGENNTALGSLALNENVTGDGNTAAGKEALEGNTNASENTAIGYRALYLNNSGGSLGSKNTASGYLSMYGNTTGSGNTAMGTESLYDNTSGNYNVAMGALACHDNTSGDGNVGVGYRANESCATGDYNTAIGALALVNNSANKNTAVGAAALINNYNGEENTALGVDALLYNSPSDGNTILGALSDMDGGGSYSNSSAIGYGAIVTNSNEIWLGNANVTSIESTMGVLQPSDGRFKFNVNEKDVKGLSFILKLRPLVYNFDTRKFTEFNCTNLTQKKRETLLNEDYTESTNIRQSGFIAQEVEKACLEANYNFNGLKKPKGEHGHYALGYSLFVVPIVKAVQEQQNRLKEMEELRAQILFDAEQVKKYLYEVEEYSQQNALENLTCTTTKLFLMDRLEKLTELSFYYPNNCNMEYLRIYQMNGTEILKVKLDEFKNGIVKYEELMLTPGLYELGLGTMNELKTRTQVVYIK
jgi:hypothetical protein